MKKYTEQDIINKFQDFDFDPKGVNKQAVYNKVKQGKAKSAKLKYFGLGLTAVAACVLVFMVIPKQGIISDDFSSKPVEESLIAQSSAPAAVVANSNDLSKAMVAYKAAGSLSSAKTTWGPSAVQAPNIALMRNSSMGISAAPIAGRGMSYQPPMPVIIVASQPSYNNMDDEKYTEFKQNRFKLAAAEPLSTFSADVDTASYTIVKRYIEQGQIPPAEAVRAEEFINYFSYNYPAPKDDKPVNIITQYAPAPWNDSHKLLKIGVKAKDITEENLPRANLVFLIDISGSMEEENRLPLIKKSLKMLVEKLRPSDMVSIVTYAGGTNIRLDGVKAKDKQKIRDVIDSLYASGSTNGSSGLTMAYKVAKSNFIKNGNNRVILATDGDFNVGPTSSKEMEAQITEARKSDVFLSVIGVGMGNYKDERIQLLANKGNGNYAYINDLFDAQKVFVKEFGATMFTVAKDVKFQVEFNPSQVAAYRLIGYEKRALNNEDFNDDTKDAGELGAGHTVTVLYEIIPVGVKSADIPSVDSLKYSSAASDSDEILTVKLRYKDPKSDVSKLLQTALAKRQATSFDNAGEDFRFASAVAAFAQKLNNSGDTGKMSIEDIINIAKKSKGADDDGSRADFIKLVNLYNSLPKPK